MEGALVFALVALVVGLALWPAARRWLGSGGTSSMVDPNQNIRVEGGDGAFGTYGWRYRSRFNPRGRRHRAPGTPSADRVRRDPPPAR
ncbi:MAG TPA: hypothetical protein VF114_08770 [Candidatus Limnocylindria bacterium]